MRKYVFMLAALMSLPLTCQSALAGHKRLVILGVAVDFVNEQLIITGRGFTTSPSVTLADVALGVMTANGKEIVADCPWVTASVPSPFCVDGDFLLKVTTVVSDDDDDDDIRTRSVAYDLTIGSTGSVSDAELAAEAATREAADAKLQTAGDDEAAKRAEADAAADQARSDEAATREAADAGLQAQIDALVAQLAAEAAARAAADAGLQAQFDEVSEPGG